MRDSSFGEEQPRGWMFGGSVLGTVAIGLVLAGMGIYFFRARSAPAQIIKSEPEIRYVEKPAPVPPPVAPKPPRPAPPPPAAKIVAVRAVWDGVWRREKYPLPMIRLYQAGNSIEGNYAPNWSGVYSFRNGWMGSNTVVFVVVDRVFRTHFRMTILGPDKAMVECCVTDEDWLIALANANKMVRTPLQALEARMILEEMAKGIGKPVNLGVFVRGSI